MTVIAMSRSEIDRMNVLRRTSAREQVPARPGFVSFRMTADKISPLRVFPV